MTSFTDFNLDPTILKALERLNFKEPSPIQAEAIPLIQGGHDVIGLAETGSGKTAACAIPICNRVDIHSKHIQALIIVPTRELALQYATETQKIGVDKGVKAFALFGGEESSMQQSKLKHGVQVLVATPGRLIDFIYSRSVDLQHVETLILDEADEMLGMGFYDDLNFIIDCLVHSHQTLLFSATMQPQVRKIAEKHMKSPLEVKLTSQRASPKSIEHQFAFCRSEEKDVILKQLIEQSQPKQAIIFCHARYQVEKVCRFLQKQMAGVDFLHAGLGQDVRTIITNKFRNGRLRFLVATDVAARGLDFSGVTHVFLYQLPEDIDIYIHRSGRTGRREREGVVVSLVTKRDLPTVEKLEKRLDRKPIWVGKAPEPVVYSPGSRSSYRGVRNRLPPKKKI